MKRKVYIIIPVYNEGKVVGEVVKHVRKRFKNVVCVDDGSTDNTAKQIADADGILVQHTINLGQGAALQTGLEYALQDPDAAFFVTYDADGQHDLQDVEHMLATIEQEKIDVVLGSRFLGKAEHVGRAKKILLKIAVKFSNHTSGLKLTDTHNGLRVFNRKAATGLNITMPDFSHASEIIERIAEEKFTYKEVPVTIRYTAYSRAKGQSFMNAVNIGFDVLLSRITKK